MPAQQINTVMDMCTEYQPDGVVTKSQGWEAWKKIFEGCLPLRTFKKNKTPPYIPPKHDDQEQNLCKSAVSFTSGLKDDCKA